MPACAQHVQSTHVEGRGQLMGVNSLLPCALLGSGSGCQAWEQVFLLAKHRAGTWVGLIGPTDLSKSLRWRAETYVPEGIYIQISTPLPLTPL